jgi:two-component system cell cycle response regulator DivK
LKKKAVVDNNLFKGKTIIVIEDDPISSEYMYEVLNGLDAELKFFDNGEEFLDYLNEDGIAHLVLMDIRLPGINGYQVTSQIKSKNPDIAIIAQTAYALEGDREKALNAGCNDYISKPIRSDELMELISKYI